MKEKVKQIYQLFDNKRKAYEAIQADNEDIEELKQLEEKIQTNEQGRIDHGSGRVVNGSISNLKY